MLAGTRTCTHIMTCGNYTVRIGGRHRPCSQQRAQTQWD
jgi:hypothetical protein